MPHLSPAEKIGLLHRNAPGSTPSEKLRKRYRDADAPTFADGDVYSHDFVNGHTIRFAEWSTYGNAHGATESATALVQSNFTMDDANRLIKVARANIRSFLKARGELGLGYRLKLNWQVDFSTDYARPVIVFRAWEI